MLLNEIKIPTRTQNALALKGIYTVNDLAMYFPRKYLDYRKIYGLYEAVGQDCAIAGYLESYEKDSGETCSHIVAHIIEEETGEKVAVHWFGQAYQLESIKKFARKEIVVCGVVNKHPVYGYTVMNPYSYHLREIYTGKIVPVYRKISGVSDDNLKRWINECIKHSHDPLDAEIVVKTKLPEYQEALKIIHNPKDMEELNQANRRIIFNDMLYFCTRLKMRESTGVKKSSFTMPSIKLAKRYIGSLPYQLTADQDKAVCSIYKTMAEGNRVDAVVQGDVGCGKTTVAFASMFIAASNGYTSAIMAPTSILAKQHYEELSVYASAQGLSVAYLDGATKEKEKKAIKEKITNGEYAFIVGTHSLYSKDVVYKNLSLIITDEEHRFGVEQKELLKEKADTGVHVISMSATPIPRTFADILYGENKVLITIESLPAGRQKVKTKIYNSEKGIMAHIEAQLREGRQCYVVCPTIESSEENKLGLESIEKSEVSYKSHFEPLGYKVGVLTGKTKKAEASAILDAFKAGDIRILIATTVIEVGVNVPNANTIVINNAERFGLPQLHQLRGRICRGNYTPYCILKSAQTDNKRLLTMEAYTDGYSIAKADLEQRGLGDLLGTAQSGTNHYMDLVIAMPNLFNRVKLYAQLLLDQRKEGALIQLYEEQKEAS